MLFVYGSQTSFLSKRLISSFVHVTGGLGGVMQKNIISLFSFPCYKELPENLRAGEFLGQGSNRQINALCVKNILSPIDRVSAWTCSHTLSDNMKSWNWYRVSTCLFFFGGGSYSRQINKMKQWNEIKMAGVAEIGWSSSLVSTLSTLKPWNTAFPTMQFGGTLKFLKTWKPAFYFIAVIY